MCLFFPLENNMQVIHPAKVSPIQTEIQNILHLNNTVLFKL